MDYSEMLFETDFSCINMLKQNIAATTVLHEEIFSRYFQI